MKLDIAVRRYVFSRPCLWSLSMPAAVLTATAPALAGPSPAARCAAAKQKAIGKYQACLMGSDLKALAKETAVDDSKCDAKFAKAWGKAETKGGSDCPTLGDQGTVGAEAAACEDSVLAAVGNPAAGTRCHGSKAKAAGKFLACRAGGVAKATIKGGPADVERCGDKIELAFSKAEAANPGQCPATDDLASVGAVVVSCQDTILYGLLGTPTTTTTTTPPPTSTTMPDPTLIFADDFDFGTMADWSSSFVSGGSTLGYLTTGGFARALHATGFSAYNQYDMPMGEKVFRAEMVMNLDPLGAANFGGGTPSFLYGSSVSAGRVAFVLYARVNPTMSGAPYQVGFFSWTDTGGYNSQQWVDAPADWFALTFQWVGSSAPGANDGLFRLTTPLGTVEDTGLDNDLSNVERFQVGAIANNGAANVDLAIESFAAYRTLNP